MKTPIVGDLKYGAPQPNEDASICLHAFSLKFTHPVTKENLYIKTQPPMISAWKKFEKHILSLS
jgi:23S rRNA pseudouridine1911/1915/1917 synthase